MSSIKYAPRAEHGGIVQFTELESGRARPTQVAIISDDDLNRERLPGPHRGGEVVPEDGCTEVGGVVKLPGARGGGFDVLVRVV